MLARLQALAAAVSDTAQAKARAKQPTRDGTDPSAAARVPHFEVLSRDRALDVMPCFTADFELNKAEIECALQGGYFSGPEPGSTCPTTTTTTTTNNNKINATPVESVFAAPKQGYDYTHSFAPAVRHKGAREWVCAAVVVEVVRKVKRETQRVWEVIWFSSAPGQKGVGYGAALFNFLLKLAVRAGIHSLLLESSTKALTYWLTRPLCPIARVLIRCAEGVDVRTGQLSPYEKDQRRNEVIVRNLLHSNAGEVEKNPSQQAKRKPRRRNRRKGPAPTFWVKSDPPVELEWLYSDKVLRDSKGRPSRHSCFTGKPYRFGADQSTHIIYPTSPAFVARLANSGMLVKHSLAVSAKLRALCAVAKGQVGSGREGGEHMTTTDAKSGDPNLNNVPATNCLNNKQRTSNFSTNEVRPSLWNRPSPRKRASVGLPTRAPRVRRARASSSLVQSSSSLPFVPGSRPYASRASISDFRAGSTGKLMSSAQLKMMARPRQRRPRCASCVVSSPAATPTTPTTALTRKNRKPIAPPSRASISDFRSSVKNSTGSGSRSRRTRASSELCWSTLDSQASDLRMADFVLGRMSHRLRARVRASSEQAGSAADLPFARPQTGECSIIPTRPIRRARKVRSLSSGPLCEAGEK